MLLEVEKVPLLGYIISEGHINMEETKTKVVQDWQIPKTKNALQKFLGFLNFYRRFIKGFSAIAKPLYELTGITPLYGQKPKTKPLKD